MMKKASLFMVLMLVAGLLISGCAENFDEISYTYPNWTPEGLIYSIKSVTHRVRRPGGLGFGTVTETLGTDYYYVTMDTEGNNEATLPYSSYPYYSPKGTYVALINGGKISIVRRSDNQTVYEFTPTADSISELDWGPEEDKLVYLTSKKDLNIVNIDGTNSELLTTAEADIFWKYGNSVFFAKANTDIYSRLTSVDISNKHVTIFNEAKALEPQISGVNTQEVIYRNEKNIEQINISDPLNNPDVLFGNFSHGYIKLSPDAKKIIAGEILNSGIWIIDISGENIKQLK